DFYGDRGEKLYCLQRPSDMQQEIFTVVIAGIVLMLGLLVLGLFSYRKRVVKREARAAVAEAREEGGRKKARKEERMLREAEEAKQQVEKQRTVLPEAETEVDVKMIATLRSGATKKSLA
ncbi:unnamed protein product, partial [Polarella glacialis]